VSWTATCLLAKAASLAFVEVPDVDEAKSGTDRDCATVPPSISAKPSSSKWAPLLPWSHPDHRGTHADGAAATLLAHFCPVQESFL
jgi:hypothetical protein